MIKKRILLWGLNDSKHLGGIEQYLFNLVNNSNRDKYQFCFMVLKGTTPCFYNELINLGCKFYYITSRRDNFYKNFNDISTLLDNEYFDVVHCHFSSLSYIAPCIIANKKNIKTIVHSHNAYITGSILSIFFHFINYFRIKHIDVIRIAVSDKAGKWFFKNDNYLVLNNNIDVDKYSFSSESRRIIREKLHIDDNATVLINVASYKPEKNHIFLLDVFSNYIKVANNKCVLLLAGEGERKNLIIKKSKKLGISDKIVFLGSVNNVNDYLSASDIFVMPSKHEGYPFALIEAQCCGLPCVVSKEITHEAINDKLCKVISIDNYSDWIKAIDDIDITNREEKSIIAKKWLISKNNSNIKIEDIYDKL